MDKMQIGSTPWGEDCTQTTDPDYQAKGQKECREYMQQLKRHYTASHDEKELPCMLVIVGNPHDYGTYYTVDAMWDPTNEAAEAAAYWLESNSPELWDEVARQNMGLVSDDN